MLFAPARLLSRAAHFRTSSAVPSCLAHEPSAHLTKVECVECSPSALDWLSQTLPRKVPKVSFCVCHSMQRSSEDGQTAGPGKPTKEPSHPLSSKSSQDTLVVSEKKFVTLEDFDYVDFAAAEFSDDEIKEFKQLFFGWKLPPKPETASDEKLRSLGYKGPNPWVTYYLEQRILNS